MKTLKIQKGTIRCKYCNQIYPDAVSAFDCPCGKGKKWYSPFRHRTNEEEKRLKRKGFSKSFLAMIQAKKDKTRKTTKPNKTGA